MSSSFTQPHSYSHPAISSDIPNELISGNATRPIPSIHKLVACQSTSGAQGASGVSTINIPASANSFLKSGSAYIRIVGQATFEGNAVVSACAFGNSVKSISSLISKITLNSGATQLETFSSYGTALEPVLVSHASNAGYYFNDYAIMEKMSTGLGTLITAAGAGDITYDIQGTIPLIFGCLNGAQSWPLYLAPLQVIIDWAPLATAFTSTAGKLVISYTITKCDIVYENIRVESDLVSASISEMANGSEYVIPVNTFMVLAKGTETPMRYEVALSMGSVNAIFATNCAAHALGAQKLLKNCAQTKFNIYVDNQLVNTIGDLNSSDIAMVHAEMQRAFGSLGDTTITSAVSVAGAGAISTDYLTKFYACGLSLRRFADSFALAGTKVGNLTVEAEFATIVGGDICYMIVSYGMLITIDANGAVRRTI